MGNNVNSKYIIDNASIRLMETKTHAKELNTLPHREFLDLSITYWYRFDNNAIMITNKVAKANNITEKELFNAAIINLNFEKYGLFSLAKFCGTPENDCEAKVATIKNSVYGARALLRNDILDKVAREFNSNVYILPSSIHEILLYNTSLDGTELKKIVEEINGDAEIIKSEDVLSNTVYLYDRETKQVSVYA